MRRLKVIIDDPPEVARRMVRGMEAVREFRRERSDSYNFNWLLSVRREFQRPFEVTHESMRSLMLARAQPAHELAANLRRAFSGIVTGNVKELRRPGHRDARAVRAQPVIRRSCAAR